MDGASCPSRKITSAYYGGSGNNEHRPADMVGYCSGISTGQHTLTVAISSDSGSDCYTGWTGRFYLEAQEVMPTNPFLHYADGVGVDGRDNGLVQGRTLTFSKAADDSVLRILYMDNFRNVGNGGSCFWEVLIDGASCPSGKVVGMEHTSNSDNNHHPSALVASCAGVAAGSHTLTVKLTSTTDCYTGWPGDAVWTLEAEEKPQDDPYYTALKAPGGNQQIDIGLVPGRSMSFTKMRADSL